MPATTDQTGGNAGENTARLTKRIVAALRRLPTWGHHDVLRERLLLVLRHNEQTGDIAAVEHFTESLVLTARMERSPAFLATSESTETPGEPRDVREVVAEIEARHDGTGE
ncbi:MAG TPA: hypothetical protein VHV74_18310 [Pseudonocardiaceae bacterium]|nr:hypothetical protein [Pseudonocardiaceae bacterium]